MENTQAAANKSGGRLLKFWYVIMDNSYRVDVVIPTTELEFLSKTAVVWPEVLRSTEQAPTRG